MDKYLNEKGLVAIIDKIKEQETVSITENELIQEWERPFKIKNRGE